MMRDTLKLHSVKDEFLARGRVILTKGHGDTYHMIVGKGGFNAYDRIQVKSFVEQLNELTEEEYDIKDKKIRSEIRKISSRIERQNDDSIRPSSFYFRLPDIPKIEGMAKK